MKKNNGLPRGEMLVNEWSGTAHGGFFACFPHVRVLRIMLIVLLILLGTASAYAGNPEDVPPALTDAPEGMLFRWVPPFYMTVPSTWKPMVERRDGIGFFTGAHPEAFEESASGNIAMVALMVMKQPAPKGGGYKDFFADIEKEAANGTVKNFVSREEETTIGGQPAVFYSFSGEGDVGGTSRKMEGNMVVSVGADADGKHTLAVLMGTPASVEEHRDEIRTMLASAREARPPLSPSHVFPYGATQNSFRHVYGPAVAADGVIALGESLGEGRIRIFDPEGKQLAEWGSRGKGEDGTFNYPEAMAFGPDGSLYVADKGYSVDPHVQRFSRTGEFLGKIRLDSKALGEQWLYNPSHLAVTDSGKIVVIGLSEIQDGVPRALVLSPEGALLSEWSPGEIGGLAALPGDRVVVSRARPGNDRAGFFAILDLQGKTLKEWPFFGSDLAATPGDEKIYFRPEFLAADAEGRVYAYDDSEDSIWMYDAEGEFMYAVPVRPHLRIVGGMAVTPGGDLIFQDRPNGPGENSIHRWENAFPARMVSSEDVPLVPEAAGEAVVEQESAEPLAPKVPEASGEPTPLEAELRRLKEALRLRETAELLDEEGDLSGAAAKYRESLLLHEDHVVEEYAADLEQRSKLASMVEDFPVVEEPPVKEEPAIQEKPAVQEESMKEPTEKEEPPMQEPPKVVRSPLYDRAEELERSGAHYDALLKYREALAAEADEAMKEHADALEKTLEAEARKVVERAVVVQKEGKLEEALDLYRESLNIYPVERIREYAERLDALVQDRKQGGEARIRAEVIWKQAAELQKAKKYDDALAKYREGFSIFHNAAVEEHIERLEDFIRNRK